MYGKSTIYCNADTELQVHNYSYKYTKGYNLHTLYLIESFLMIHRMFYILDLNFVHTDFRELYLGFQAGVSAQLLLLPFVFFQDQGG